jgi:predicted dehydrogenase
MGVIGAGNITASRHIPALRASGRVKILGVMDTDLVRAQAVAERFGIPHWSCDWEADWLKEVVAVTIGVPPAAHVAAARQAIVAGKHVLLEKPMTLLPQEADDLVARAKTAGRILAVVHNFQFSRSACRAKRLIAEGKLGTVCNLLAFQTSTATRRLPVWHEELPLGLFFDEAPHLFYLMRAFGGDISVRSVAITPSAQGRRTPAVITAHLDAGGIPAVLYNNFEATVSEWHFAIYGTRAAAIIDVFRDVLVVLPHDGQHLSREVIRTSLKSIYDHLWGTFTSGLQMLRGRLLYGNDEVVRRFLDAVETGRPPEAISAEDGARMIHALDCVLRVAGAR